MHSVRPLPCCQIAHLLTVRCAVQGSSQVLAGTPQLLPLLHSLEAHVRSGNPTGALAEELLEQASPLKAQGCRQPPLAVHLTPHNAPAHVVTQEAAAQDPTTTLGIMRRHGRSSSLDSVLEL